MDFESLIVGFPIVQQPIYCFQSLTQRVVVDAQSLGGLANVVPVVEDSNMVSAKLVLLFRSWLSKGPIVDWTKASRSSEVSSLNNVA